MKSVLTLYLTCALFSTMAFVEAADNFSTRPPLFWGMGTNSLPINTRNELAQKYFDQALVLYYGYNFPEAARSFRAARELAPDRAICCWGEALAFGDCIGELGDHWCVSTCQAIERAKALPPEKKEFHNDLVQALAMRYQSNNGEYHFDQKGYIARMKELCKKYPNNPDLLAIYVKGHMDNYDMLEGMEGRTPVGETKEILDALKKGLAIDPKHPGLLHFEIHAVENAGISDQGLPAANALLDLVPGSGHLQHMPAHIYFYVGRYHDATVANMKGIEADHRLFREGGILEPEFGGFYLHNYFFLFHSLTMEGRGREALAEARKLVHILQSGQIPSDNYLKDIFYSVPYLTEARFEMWDELSKEPPPQKNLPFTTGAWHYAKGLADLSRGNVTSAKRQLEILTKIETTHQKENPDDALGKLLTLTRLDLSSEIAGRLGDTDKQIYDLSQAISIEDGIDVHMLPWYFPLRLAIGAAFYKAGALPNAEQALRDSLERHPNNGWALSALIRVLDKTGNTKEADQLRKQLAVSWQYADRTTSGTRFPKSRRG